MDYVRCSGDEARLAECEFGFAQSCAHSSDASVGCYGGILYVCTYVRTYNNIHRIICTYTCTSKIAHNNEQQ